MKLKRLTVLLLVLAFMFSFTSCKESTTVERVVASEGNFVMAISINPEVQFVVDSETGLVTEVVCLNSDAEDLINKLNLNLVGLSYDEASETFMKACADEGYLNASNNNITVSAEGEASDEIYDTYGEKMETACQNVDDYTDFEITVDMTCFPCHGTGNCDLCNGEGKYKCTVCNGEAGSSCSECGGDGKIDCADCNGTGGCTKCGKTGVITCDKCGGAGCANCNNTGKMECTNCHGHSTCEACNGSGSQNCLTCAGTGKTTCYRCNSTGYETCPRCDGDGHCPTCHGNGTLTEDQLIP